MEPTGPSDGKEDDTNDSEGDAYDENVNAEDNENIGEDGDEWSVVSSAYSDESMRRGSDGFNSPVPSESTVYSEVSEGENDQELFEDECEEESEEEVPNPNPDPGPNPNPNPNPNPDPGPNPNPNPNPNVVAPRGGVFQRRQALLVNTVQDLLCRNNISDIQAADFLDKLSLSLLLFGVPSKSVLPITTAHRLDQASKNGEIPIDSYSHCKKCDCLKRIEMITNCECKRQHSNLVEHKVSINGVKGTAQYSVVCGFNKAPKAKQVKPCDQPLAKLVKGVFQPVRQVHLTKIGDWIRSIFGIWDIEAVLTARFQYVLDRPQQGGCNWTTPYWEAFENKLPPGSLSQENWFNLVLFLNVDWFGKSKNIQGDDAHMGGMYLTVVNLLEAHQKNPKFTLQFGTMEGKEPHHMWHITDVLYTEMLELSKNGIPITLPNGRAIQSRAFLYECICDSEGRHKVAGHKCKNHSMPCMDCAHKPRRGVHAMHADFTMTKQEIDMLHNGDFNRDPGFDMKGYMKKHKNARLMKIRKAMEQETGYDFSTLCKLQGFVDIKKFFGPDPMHLVAGIFLSSHVNIIYVYK